MYNLDVVKPILIDNNNAILHKVLYDDIINVEKIIISHSLVYVVNGTVKISTYDYDEITISNSEMLFMAKDSYIISDYIKDNKNLEVYLFFFDYNIATEFLKTIKISNNKRDINLLKLTISENLKHYIKSIQNTNYNNIYNKQLLYSKIFELLHIISENNELFISALYQSEIKINKQDIKTYMSNHYDKNLTVSDWATLSGKSLSTINRQFKKKYFISPKKWLLKQNMEIGYQMLKNGSTVSQCSIELGYQNSSNFIKAYKDIYNTTPKQHIK